MTISDDSQTEQARDILTLEMNVREKKVNRFDQKNGSKTLEVPQALNVMEKLDMLDKKISAFKFDSNTASARKPRHCVDTPYQPSRSIILQGGLGELCEDGTETRQIILNKITMLLNDKACDF